VLVRGLGGGATTCHIVPQPDEKPLCNSEKRVLCSIQGCRDWFLSMNLVLKQTFKQIFQIFSAERRKLRFFLNLKLETHGVVETLA